MGNKGAVFLATLSGLLFGIGWWMFIDACAMSNYDKKETVEFVDALPMTGVTIFFILLVGFQWSYLEGEDYMYSGGLCGGNVQAWSRILLFITIMCGMMSIIGAMLSLIQKWAKKYPYFGVMQLLSTILVFIAAVCWAVGRYRTRNDIPL